ncbi:hypothetical protein MAPG_09033 [Magnaporthiopsis poae ATCC 64411]|uniref:Alpha/beta hydrolase n=1 Tax=Magnaporthiopsis poae (strain ATCC 64411 / 73-15) TaxID=644358 RepID=A0A0C4E8W3_MAGP6|nr:hypothetical protein MAPG_09033 [Magnaporthiopsis poae ATCC 64411]
MPALSSRGYNLSSSGTTVVKDVASQLSAAGVTLKGVSHFAPLQDPEQFTKAIEDFLKA